MKTHGKSQTKIYRLWIGMKSRCGNKNNTGYKNYGGRGISVCSEWLDFNTFYQWAKDKWQRGLEIDRIDNNSNYSPENCHFVTKTYQTLNQRLERKNTSGHVGVNWDKQKKKWRSRVFIKGHEKHLGFYADKTEAIKARVNYVNTYKAMVEEGEVK